MDVSFLTLSYLRCGWGGIIPTPGVRICRNLSGGISRIGLEQMQTFARDGYVCVGKRREGGVGYFARK